MLAIGSFSVNAITKRIGPRRVVEFSFVLFFLGCILAALAGTLPMLIVCQTILGLALGVSYPTLMGLSIRTVIESERTIAMGLHQTWYAMGMFVGPAVSGLVAQALGIQRMFAVTGVLALVFGYFGSRRLAER